MSAGTLDGIMAKYALRLAKVREKRKAEQMRKAERDAKLAVRSKL